MNGGCAADAFLSLLFHSPHTVVFPIILSCFTTVLRFIDLFFFFFFFVVHVSNALLCLLSMVNPGVDGVVTVYFTLHLGGPKAITLSIADAIISSSFLFLMAISILLSHMPWCVELSM